MNKKIRVGIVGWGFSAKTFHKILSEKENISYIGVYSRTPPIEKGIIICDSFEKLLNQKLDAIIIAIQPSFQAEYIIKGFKNDLHVLCEKPIATNITDLSAIMSAWKKSNKIGMINFCYRLNEQFIHFRSAIENKIIGHVNYIKAEWILKNRLNQELTTHWKCQKEAGGGVLNNFGSHLLDFLTQGHNYDDINLLAISQQTLYHERFDKNGMVDCCSGDEVSTVLMEIDKIPSTVHISSISDMNSGLEITAFGTEGTIKLHSTKDTSAGFPYVVSLKKSDHYKEISRGNCDQDMTCLYNKSVDKFIHAISINMDSKYIRPSIEDGYKVFKIINC